MNVCGRWCETGETISVSIENGKISGVRLGVNEAELGSPDVWLSSGFFDLQLNGYGGYDFNVNAWGSANEVRTDPAAAIRSVAHSGTALLCPTFTTNSHEAISTGMKALCRALESDPQLSRAVPGIHLEGPYIASEDGPRGAHPLEHVRDPDWDEFQSFQEAANGLIRLCTLAPEREGALRFIEHLTEAGVTVAIGHTGAEPEIIRDAVLAGARLSTHLGNGSHSQIRRHPNYIWEQLACDQLYTSVIADGHHLPAPVLKSFARVKGSERLALVSDTVALGGLPPGRYMDGRYEVLPSGKIVLAGTPYLAGAGHLMDTCVANTLRYTDLTIAQTTRCASAIPARILGLEARKGHIGIGYDADLTLFRIDAEGVLEVVATLCGGEVVFSKEN